MGIFDFLKKKNNKQENIAVQAQTYEKEETVILNNDEMIEEKVSSVSVEEKKESDLYEKIKIYNEYIVYSIALQLRGDYAPISAFQKENGEVDGFLYMIKDESYTLTAQQVIDKMQEKFENELKEGKIRSYVILYHSQFDHNGNHALATRDEELKAISVAYHFQNDDKSTIGLPYVFEKDEISYRGFAEFSPEENNEIMNTQLTEGKDYFTSKEEIEVPESINEAGIKIKKSNANTLANTWSGIFGYEKFQNTNISNYLVQTMALCRMEGAEYEKEKINFTEFQDVAFKTVFSEEFSTIFPEVKTDYALDFETKEINEWENASNMEAIVAGSGRDTFGLWFYATDYAKNKDVYLTQKNLNINISGIIFVLDIHKNFDLPDGTKMGDDFTAYMPNKDVPNYACFDFIGKLIDFRETEVLPDKSVKGYILKLKLINNEEMEDFFTIDVFVNKENMRFETLTKGMMLTGAVQFQGKISE